MGGRGNGVLMRIMGVRVPEDPDINFTNLSTNHCSEDALNLGVDNYYVNNAFKNLRSITLQSQTWKSHAPDRLDFIYKRIWLHAKHVLKRFSTVTASDILANFDLSKQKVSFTDDRKQKDSDSGISLDQGSSSSSYSKQEKKNGTSKNEPNICKRDSGMSLQDGLYAESSDGSETRDKSFPHPAVEEFISHVSPSYEW